MESHESNGLLGLLLRPVTIAFHVTSLLWQKATQDGHLGRAGVMGLDEIGLALKAFPDSIHGSAREAVADNSYCGPSPSEIVSSHGGGESVYGYDQEQQRQRSPSEIVAEHAGVQGQGSVHGRDQDDGPPRSPSEIAADNGRPGRDKSFVEEEMERRQKQGENDSDGYGRGRGRSLPDEERQQEQEQERGRGR